MKHSFIAALSAAILLSSCASQRAVEKVRYFQDLEDGASYATRVEQAITVKPEDKLTIVVNSKDPELAGMYNLPVISRYLAAEGSSFSQNQSVASYTVDRKGNIDFPILGSIKVEGRTRDEIAEKIKSELVDRNLIRDPVVTVEFMNMYISVLGEVNKPGRYNFNQDRLTLIEALGLAGDLTIYGRRDNVKVLREVDGQQKVFMVDLRSGADLYNSPVFYLQQKDIIYVDPNVVRMRQSTVNGNNVRSTSFWISIASVLTSVAVLITNILNNSNRNKGTN